MSEEFDDLSSRIPDFNSALTARVLAKTGGTVNSPPGTVDPYQLMLQKKTGQVTGQDTGQVEVVQWPEEDVKKLEDYCKRIGIVGFNSGRTPPIIALALLKKQIGDFEGVPLEDRLVDGYERRGTPSAHNPNYPYADTRSKKQVLHG